MGFVLILFSFIMNYLIERYNNMDYFSNIVVDILVQILHIITILSIFFSFMFLDIGLFLTIIGLFFTVIILLNAITYLVTSIKNRNVLDYTHNSSIDINNKKNQENIENNKDIIISNDDDKKER